MPLQTKLPFLKYDHRRRDVVLVHTSSVSIVRALLEKESAQDNLERTYTKR